MVSFYGFINTLTNVVSFHSDHKQWLWDYFLLQYQWHKLLQKYHSQDFHTHQHPAKKGHIHPHPATPSMKNITFTHTQPKNGRTYPNPPIPSQKRSHFPTPTHNQIKKVTASQKKVMPTHA